MTRLLRNKKDLMGRKIKKNVITLEWWDATDNLGDSLAPIIFNWMLQRKRINNKDVKSTRHLMTVGSLLGASNFDAIVWGSGLMNAKNTVGLVKYSKYIKYDIRAVRGPITREMLIQIGYDCPSVYGDPAILMPLIYNPKNIEKCYTCSVILHHLSSIEENSNYNFINIKTTDYKKFINEIISSKLVISSSLHGIILAEAYGVPAIFLNVGVSDQSAKYLDWYYSTGRYNVKMIQSLQDSENISPMELPDLSQMQSSLLESFPYDLWN